MSMTYDEYNKCFDHLHLKMDYINSLYGYGFIDLYETSRLRAPLDVHAIQLARAYYLDGYTDG